MHRCGVQGQTTPQAFYLHDAASGGVDENAIRNDKLIIDELKAAGGTVDELVGELIAVDVETNERAHDGTGRSSLQHAGAGCFLAAFWPVED